MFDRQTFLTHQSIVWTSRNCGYNSKYIILLGNTTKGKKGKTIIINIKHWPKCTKLGWKLAHLSIKMDFF